MKNILSKKFLILLFLSVHGSSSYALEIATHKAINKYIAQNTLNSFSLDSYLKNNLGLTNGKEEEFTSDKTRKVFEWVELGGEYEDIPAWYLPYIRSLNHFHNPLTEEGFRGDCLQSSLCVSSTVWALMPLGTQSSLTGNYSWDDVRAYYYTALTGRDYSGNIIAADKTQRDAYFAETFRGLGQLMHLIEDASVPAHTRNDFHYFYNYEKWVETNVNDIRLPNYGSTFFSGTINNIASFIDTNQYNNPTPDPTVTTNNTIGLSEYTQANFFSEDTIFGSNFPYPQITQGMPVREDDFTNNMTTYKRQYYIKNCCGETKGGLGYRLAAVDLLDYWRQQDPERYGGLSKIPALDDNVYSDYASLLIPRAVGYSAGLLNYFFRGQIDMVPDTNSPGNYIIENYGNEAINANDGVFTLYYDGTDELRHQINWSFPSDGRISVPAADATGPGKSISVSFPEPTDAMEAGKYVLVFKGKLGNENDAVVGKEVKEDNIVVAGQDTTIGLNPKNGATLFITSKSYTIGVASYDGDIFIFYGNYYGQSLRLCRIDNKGNVKWEQVIGTPMSNYDLGQLVAVGKDGIAISYSKNMSNGPAHLEKRSLTDGSLMWEVDLPYWQSLAVATNDGETFYIIGAMEGVYDESIGGYRYPIQLCSYSAGEGLNIIATITSDGTVGYYPFWWNHLEVSKEYIYLTYGFVGYSLDEWGSLAPYTQGRMQKRSIAGDIIWDKMIVGAPGAFDDGHILDMEVDKDAIYLTTDREIYLEYENGYYSGYKKLSLAGDVLFDREYNIYTENYYPVSLAICDKGLFIAGKNPNSYNVNYRLLSKENLTDILWEVTSGYMYPVSSVSSSQN